MKNSPLNSRARRKYVTGLLPLLLLFLFIPNSVGCKDGGKEFRRVLRSAARTPSKKAPGKNAKSTEKVASLAKTNKDGIKICPKQARLIGAPYPRGISQWCAASSKDGKEVRHGGYRRWHKNGNLKVKANYYLGKHDGKIETFFKSGTPREVVSYDKGVKNGEFRQWNKDGTQKVKGFYSAGSKHGDFAWWTRGGQLKEQGGFANDLKTGEWVSFHRSGSIKSKSRWLDGRLNGPSDTFGRDGNISKREVYALNLPDGRWISFHRNGRKKQEGTFSEGQKHGHWVQYARDGSIRKTTIFDRGTVIGQQDRGRSSSRRAKKRRKGGFGKGDILGAEPPVTTNRNANVLAPKVPSKKTPSKVANTRKGFGEEEEEAKETGWEPL